MDLVELIKIVDNVSSEVRLQERTPVIKPLTAMQMKKKKKQVNKILSKTVLG